jgi:enamine deaminase RidA (YjgF/YER057c/UK114 family)
MINLGEPRPAFSDAILAGDTLYVSGQVALDPDGELVGADDPLAQAEQCFVNLGRVLASAGMTFDDVVALRCYLVTLDAYPDYAAVKQRLFTKSPPAGTAFLVAGLLLPGLLLEVEAVAVR